MTLEQILKKPDARREWVKFQLGLHGSSFADLGRQLGVSRSCVLRAFYTSYPKMERLIAAAIDMHPADIWPERYQNNKKVVNQ